MVARKWVSSACEILPIIIRLSLIRIISIEGICVVLLQCFLVVQLFFPTLRSQVPDPKIDYEVVRERQRSLFGCISHD